MHVTRIVFTHSWCTQTAKIGSLSEINELDDAEGLRVFYYLVQDLKVLLASHGALGFC